MLSTDIYIDLLTIITLYVDIGKRKMKVNDFPNTILMFFIYGFLFI